MSETHRTKYRAHENEAAREIAGLFKLGEGSSPFGIVLDFDSAEIVVTRHINGGWTQVEVTIAITRNDWDSLLTLSGKITRTNASTMVSAGAPFLDNIDHSLLRHTVRHKDSAVLIHRRPGSIFLAGTDLTRLREPEAPEIADKVRDHIMGIVTDLDRLVPALTPGSQQ